MTSTPETPSSSVATSQAVRRRAWSLWVPLGVASLAVLVSVLDGVALRLGFDDETRLHMLKPHAIQPPAVATVAGAHHG